MSRLRPRRFAHIPHHENGCLYAVELDNGLVKVGLSSNPRTRMSTLATTCRREFASEFLQFFIGPDLAAGVSPYAAERLLLARITRMAVALPGRSEFFAGLSFDDAKALVLKVSSECQAGQRRVEGADPSGFDSLNSHGLKHGHASPATPLN
jgi:hypothetical protein